jgi:hypothetical protein
MPNPVFNSCNRPVKTEKTSGLKKQVAKVNLQTDCNKSLIHHNESQLNISQLPMLIISPEKSKSFKLTSTILNDKTITEPSLNMSTIVESKELEFDQTIAFDNCLYESPVRQTYNQTKIVNSFQESLTVHSFGYNSFDFEPAHVEMFQCEESKMKPSFV